MLLPLATLQVPKPGPLGPPSPLPPAAPIRLAAPQKWRIQGVPTPHELPYDPKGVTVNVRGRRVRLRTSDDWNKIDGVQVGRDGSILVHRASIQDPRWEFQDFVWYRGQETAVYGAQAYRDRRNYAGSFVRDKNAIGMPESAPEAMVTQNGRARQLGWGSVREWGADGTFVLEVPVGDDGQPAGTEFTSGAVTRILSGGREWRVRDYGYLGRAKDGTVVLASGATSSSVGGGFVSLSKKAVPSNRLLFWRGGRFVAHVALPEGWRAEGLAPDGWVLARPVPKAAPMPSFEGMKASEVSAAMERMASDASDATIQAERDWTAGLLRGSTLTPVTFPKPKGAERLLWRGGAKAFGPRAFRFTAFWGDDERTYRVAPPLGTTAK